MFKKLLDEWLIATKSNVKPRTFVTYESIVRRHISKHLGAFEIKDIDKYKLRDFFEFAATKGNEKNKLGLSPSSLRLIERILNLVVEYAEGLIDVNLMIKVKRLIGKHYKADLHNNIDIATAFDKDAQRKIVEYCYTRGRKQDVGILIALYTGLRLGEVLALQWNDVNFEKGLIKIQSSAYYCKIESDADSSYDFIYCTPKSKSSYRTVVLPDGLLELLREHKKDSLSKFIVARLDGKRIPTHSYQYAFKAILKKCEINYGSFHTLRHTFATKAIELGADIKTVSEVLGHKSAGFTLNRYIHSMLESKKMLAGRIDKVYWDEDGIV